MAAFVVPFLCFLGVDFLYKRDPARVGHSFVGMKKSMGKLRRGVELKSEKRVRCGV